ncbi:PucR family transcriptional regulator [Rhodococcus pyridinivorans]|uniref:PucR family transcriptional regulator n=1 Tax=Rhodococcus pyridinivorans TaxID=103816 RepID=UPI0019079E68|nr:helix-turn-helix domain-containing protein [Rhodococcus pyridinivorans]QQM51316.1 helix-turn-helix domain-containing protein [Rhodococcus pyridinivorans]
MSSAPPPFATDTLLLTRLLPRWPQIAERILADGLGATPPAADLPDGHFRPEVLPSIYACGRAVLQAISEGRALTRAEVADFVAPVAERHAEDRFPLASLIEAIHNSAQSVLTEAATLAAPEEIDQLVAIGSGLLDLLKNITIIVTETYTEVGQSIHNADREARRELCSALLRGRPVEALAARADTPLTDSYTVLAIHARPEDPSTATADLLARRRIRILHHTLDTLSNGTALVSFDGSTGVALIPVHTDPGHGLRTDSLSSILTEKLSAVIYLAESVAVPRTQLPDAAAEVTELATLARTLGRPPGAYCLDDLLLEYQLTRPGAARDRLAARIVPLLGAPHLLEALEAHLRFGADRKSASAHLHVHPNTLSYRLRRVGDLTGIDPGEPSNSRLLAAALTINRLYTPTGPPAA